MPDTKKKSKPGRAEAAAKAEKGIAPKTNAELNEEELTKVVGGATIKRAK